MNHVTNYTTKQHTAHKRTVDINNFQNDVSHLLGPIPWPIGETRYTDSILYNRPTMFKENSYFKAIVHWRKQL